MNNDSKETEALLEALKQRCPSDVSVMVAPTLSVQSSVNHLSNSPMRWLLKICIKLQTAHSQERLVHKYL